MSSRMQETLPALFERQVCRRPDAPAVTDGTTSWTYRELNERANQIAHRLLQSGVKHEGLVALSVGRSVDLIAAVVGILKANAAYVAIDPDYPRERRDLILEDSGVAAIVADACSAKEIGRGDIPMVVLDERLDDASRRNPTQVGDGNSAAYVIYTSGSTGRPKGVVVEHYNVIRLFDQARCIFDIGESDVWSMFHACGFDFSVWEIWGALLHGGRVVVLPSLVARSPDDLLAWLDQHQVTILSQTPTAFRQLILAEAHHKPSRRALRYIVFGGEALAPSMLKPWVERYGDCQPALVNMYGITEVTVHVTYRRIHASDCEGSAPSVIGVPLGDLEVHLFDDAERPITRPGEAGEMFVSGGGVARGYLHRPELTCERFVVRAVQGQKLRMYRTGDRALRNADGELVYLGRTDDQLKVRGYRIEPGEVEHIIEQHGGVRAAAVLAHDYGEGDVRLLAYVLASAATASREERVGLELELRRHAEATLPAHLRPSTFTVVDHFPMTPHGKLDRAALARASGPTSAIDLESTAKRLEAVWRDVLSVTKVRQDDDFFDVGGTSLALLRLLRTVNSEFCTEIRVTDIVPGRPTPARMLECVVRALQAAQSTVERRAEHA